MIQRKDVRVNNCDEKMFENIGVLEGLEELELTSCDDLTTLYFLVHLKKLRVLHLRYLSRRMNRSEFDVI